MRPVVRLKHAGAAARHLRKSLDALHALKEEIEAHKDGGRKRVLNKDDSDFYWAVERAIESFLGTEGPLNRVGILYDFWAKRRYRG